MALYETKIRDIFAALYENLLYSSKNFYRFDRKAGYTRHKHVAVIQTLELRVIYGASGTIQMPVATHKFLKAVHTKYNEIMNLGFSTRRMSW